MAENSKILPVMDVYDRFLRDLDTWFRSVRVKYGEQMQCGGGCTDCCYGIFDVPLPDAMRVAAGFHQLAPSVQEGVFRRSAAVHAQLLQAEPKLGDPFLLHQISAEDVDRLADRFDTVRCPFLDGVDECLIYASRPLACIMEGIPMVDAADGLFDDWCRLNFTSGLDEAVEADMVLDYYGIEATVQNSTEALLELLPVFGKKAPTAFLPGIVVTYDTFWQPLLHQQP
jgi:Fe-S-cluster containining protein